MKKGIVFISSILALSCSNSKLSQQDEVLYLQKGKQIAQATVKHLGGNLMKNMKSGGPAQAIPFCSAAANPLTQEIAKKHNVSIKRTTLKLRNQANQPTAFEKLILEQYTNNIEIGKKIQPIVKREADNKVHFYAPIKMEGKCLKCHGTVGKEVANATYDLIKSLYPKDKATGFKKGDLRGIIDITFNK